MRIKLQIVSKIIVSSLVVLAGLMFTPTLIPQAAAATCGPTTNFVTTWKTDNPGSTTSSQIRIQTTGTGYNYSVDWNNDGIMDQTGLTGNVTHDFGAPGTYTIQMCGSFPRMYINNSADRQKLLSINQWGDNAWANFNFAFDGATNLNVTATDIPNVSTVTNFNSAFRNTAVTGNASFNNWNMSSAISLSNMFAGSQFNAPINNWNVSNVTTVSSLFQNTPFNQPLNTWNTAAFTGLNNVFRGTPFNQDISGWNTSSVTSMNSVFRDATSFNQPLTGWNTSYVTNMESMFYGASAFNQPLNSWNTGNVTNMSSMFFDAKLFNQPIGSWDTTKITNMSQMFRGASAFNQPLNSWNTGAATSLYGMFFDAPAFNQPLNSWNVANVTSLLNMFRGASAFNQPLNSWNTGNVTNMEGMFSALIPRVTTSPANGRTITIVPMSFNQDLSSWNVHNVTNMRMMFGTDIANEVALQQGFGNIIVSISDPGYRQPFAQSLASWDISGLIANPGGGGYYTGASGMLSRTSLSRANYDATLVGWSARSLQSGLTLGAHGLEYCTGQAARQSISTTYSWSIVGDTYDCGVPLAAVPQVTAITIGAPSTGKAKITMSGTFVACAMTALLTLAVLYKYRRKAV